MKIEMVKPDFEHWAANVMEIATVDMKYEEVQDTIKDALESAYTQGYYLGLREGVK